MPKDEFDFADPMELSGVALFTEEDTTDAMCECFIEEFLRMGCSHKQILALFRNPHYLGMNLVMQNRGESFVREQIAEIFARWGKTVTWMDPTPVPLTPSLSPAGGKGARRAGEGEEHPGCAPSPQQRIECDSTLTDPMGAAIPKINL